MARKKEESTNEKIVRLYKEGHSFDEISRSMAIPKGNVIGIVEKYFPEYETYVQPEIDHSALEEKDKGQKRGFPFMRPKEHTAPAEPAEAPKMTVNLEMDENGFVDRTVQGIAQMLRKRSVAETAEFFNKDKAEIQAIHDNMDEHFRRQEAAAAPKPEPEEPAEEETNERGRREEFPTGIEPEKPKTGPRAKYKPPVYTKRTDPTPISQSYGLAGDDKPIGGESAEPVHNEPKFKPSFAGSAAEESQEEVKTEEPAAETVSLTGAVGGDAAEAAPEPTVSLVSPAAEETAPETFTVKLVPDEDAPEEEKKEEEHKVSLVDDLANEIPEIPSIEPVSEEALEKRLVKAPDPVEDIPEIGAAAITADADITKEDDSGMSPVEKMRQFAQEQIALNNQKIEELKSKKTDAENNAFDCNTKVETMKKKIEELQKELLQLVANKDAAAKIVSDINDEIESINQENIEYGKYI